MCLILSDRICLMFRKSIKNEEGSTEYQILGLCLLNKVCLNSINTNVARFKLFLF